MSGTPNRPKVCESARRATVAPLAVAVAVALTLSACAAVQGLSSADGDGGLFPPLAPEPALATDAPVAAPPIDPLAAPPPAAGMAMADTGGSQRVPLGSLAVPAPAAPMAAPIAQPAPPAQPAPMAQSAPMAPPAPSAQPAPPLPTAQPVAAPRRVVAANVPQAPVMLTQRQAIRDAERALATPPPPPDPAELQTVVISSGGAQIPVTGTPAREFIPASLAVPVLPPAAPAPVQMSVDDRNMIRRFVALRRLRDAELITAEEYQRRRDVNIGALLPYTKPAPGNGLERPVPAPDAIAARLQALGRSLEMRAITTRQHGLERTMILNALLSEAPAVKAPRRPPPADLLEAAAMIGKLEMLRADGLITDAEFDAEKAALDRFIETGRLPGDRTAETKPAGTPAPAAPRPQAAAAPPAPPLTGPVLHLASFRSEEAALRGWQEAQTKAGALVANLRPMVRKADLGQQQGVFYRLLIGPFASMAEAEAACIELKKANQFCRPTTAEAS